MFKLSLIITTATLSVITCVSRAASLKPANPDATPEAVALYSFLQDISGKHTLAGQHSPPLLGDTRLGTAYKSIGRYPALFGQDFGFSEPGTWDGINFRQRIVDDAIRRHRDGFIITLMWHAVRPTEDEPVTFEKSIQGELTDAEWEALVTPGSPLNERWKSQVDVIAWYLRQLQDAGVPVLWRPYHEMNGAWFWWGQREGEQGYKKLYRMLYDRLTHFHHLNNLLWVFNANEVKAEVDAKGIDHGVHPYARYYPGADVVDVLATDVYRNNFAQIDYDTLSQLADGKPIALGEVGRMPTAELLASQPKWAWFMVWGDFMSGWQDRAKFKESLGSEAVWTLDELPGAKVGAEPKLHYPVLQ